ncbi:hypothetical protein [Streptomyces anulatus]|uniref:hypothetical protein n=1 Tax=Streptomyces anulatus TaxID=1892 RepID=UPI003987B5AD
MFGGERGEGVTGSGRGDQRAGRDGEHTLGGLAGEMAAETTDEDPARVALVADAISAYLQDAFKIDDAAWAALGEAAADSDGTWSITGR